MDAVEGFIQRVRENTPIVFEPDVADTLEGISQPVPKISAIAAQPLQSSIVAPTPPPDPLGKVDSDKSHQYTVEAAVNEITKAVASGEKVGKNVEGWKKVADTLPPFATPVIEWLRLFLGG